MPIDLLAAVAWGTAGEWVGGLATAGGLVFAGYEIRLSIRQRRDEEARRQVAERERRVAMARAVSVNASFKDGEGERSGAELRTRMAYRLSNGGDFPIHNAVLTIHDPGAEDPRPQDQLGTALELIIGTVAAKETVDDEHDVRFSTEPVFAELTMLAGVLFTDVWGDHWFLSGNHRLEPREQPPRIC